MATPTKAQQKQLADILFPVRADRDIDADGVLSVPLNERWLQTETYDFNVVTLASLLREDRIVVPDFNVNTFAVDSSLAIDWVFDHPVPNTVVYLDQEDDGTLVVIDGNQRLMSIRLYLDNQFKLQKALD